MPLTNAERQKKYREKLRTQNPLKYQDIKLKNAERNKKRKKITECTEENKILKRKQWRASQNRSRIKSKDTANINSITEDNSAEIHENTFLLRKLQRRWANQRISYEEKINKMAKEVNSLKKKCNRYMYKNKKLVTLVDELKLKVNKYQIIVQNEKEMTPLTKSNSFIEQNLPNISLEEKEKVKRQLLTHHVLVNAIQDTYENTQNNKERSTLKTILGNKCIKKYNRKSEITTSVFGLKGRARQQKTTIRKNNIIISKIIKFYNRDDVSRATAGRKEFKTKGKIKIQRRYLLNTLKELYKKYRAEGGTAKLTAFKKYRPFYVLQPKLSNRETCGCIKHENFSMKIAKLNSLGMIETTSLNEILLNIVCDLDSKACAYDECSTCINKCMKFDEDNPGINDIVTWNEFSMQTHEYINKSDGKTMTTKKMVKRDIQDKLMTLTESFNQELKVMKKHAFNIKHQYTQYLLCIKNLKFTEVAIHIDFSENYACKFATEVQSMHFGASKSQVTIHTGVLYAKEKKSQSFASISASNEHGPEAIWAHLNPILIHVRNKYPLVNAVHFFSDGPATQYKQKKNFFLFTKFTVNMGFPLSTWNFSESAHGKGAADGVGGGLKRRLDDNVKHGIDIPDAYTAYTCLKNSDSIVMTFYVNEADIAEYSVEENLIPVPHTMNLHQISNSETNNEIRFRSLSCFCGDSRGYCECFDVRKHRLVKIKKPNQYDIKQTNESRLKRKTSEDIDITKLQKGKKKAKVTVLSEIRYRPENMAYENLNDFEPLRIKNMQKIDKNFNLCNTKSYKENINYDNPLPSTSGIRKYTKCTQSNVRYPDESSSDEDNEYSLHDSSEEGCYAEFLSDDEGGTYFKILMSLFVTSTYLI
ncbi:unnamed protein product [Chilo suppressalis]|uniref:Uncharacterized protein n=1 Tax=Chilo suppressalis TaxID=168631 RepID=A0ABN8L6L2_CHISP|nr:unnamed protein product [Chilo suppressalis]